MREGIQGWVRVLEEFFSRSPGLGVGARDFVLDAGLRFPDTLPELAEIMLVVGVVADHSHVLAGGGVLGGVVEVARHLHVADL